MSLALLMNDSHLWGIWAYKALKRSGIPFEVILSEDLTEDLLYRCRALFVPGGWSKNKLESLDERARKGIRDFIEGGGLYLGICGGASLACKEALGLVQIGRSRERVPSYSGPCEVALDRSHPLFKGIKKAKFYLWFPPKLEIEDPSAKVLGSFNKALSEAFVSDLCLGDHWENLAQFEKLYGISLNPDKMIGTPLLIEVPLGKGKVLLSLIHFDTPLSKEGLKVLQNLRDYYLCPNGKEYVIKKFDKNRVQSREQISLLRSYNTLFQKTKDLVMYANRNFLLTPRGNYFYQWKRGIRGLELLNLFFAFHEIVTLLSKERLSIEFIEELIELTHDIETFSLQVLDTIRREYELFRVNGSIGILEDTVLLFGKNVKSYGGLYKILINRLERVLVKLWRGW
ncbi:MAG: BPL-N domain-containing protein [Caldimicrobium sp.]|nr:BPL-N domain-containing protein [Caldimicrobium sp.]MCX7612935.1 BPL-N domain-containing protein [Caldimicrobium sp.]MDW8182098.1 BPL-N domain-containing protein [Caldimicrobium sp.]